MQLLTVACATAKKNVLLITSAHAHTRHGSAGAPSVEPQLSHIPDISGGIGGPTDVSVKPANVSLCSALSQVLYRARQKVQRDTAHALHACGMLEPHNAIII